MDRTRPYRRRLMAICLGLGLTVAAQAATAGDGSAVPLDDGNLHLLYGRWQGTALVRGTDGKVRSRSLIIFETTELSPPQGKFSRDGVQSWDTLIRLEGGKAVMAFDWDGRPFTLVRGDDGSLRLEAAFATTHRGKPRHQTITLRRVSAIIPMNDHALVLLNGNWQGWVVGRDGSGRVESRDTVRLETIASDPYWGRFHHANGQTWKTGARIENGKVLLGFAWAARAFVLMQTRDGRLHLKTVYDFPAPGSGHTFTVILDKM